MQLMTTRDSPRSEVGGQNELDPASRGCQCAQLYRKVRGIPKETTHEPKRLSTFSGPPFGMCRRALCCCLAVTLVNY